MRRFFAAALILLLSTGHSAAQVVDMRAYSRQQGFKAYQKPSASAYRKTTPRQSAAARSKAEAQAQGEQTASAETNTFSPEDGNTGKIQQTGLKIFQEKDEDKVLKFDVENPEFKKLSKSQ